MSDNRGQPGQNGKYLFRCIFVLNSFDSIDDDFSFLCLTFLRGKVGWLCCNVAERTRTEWLRKRKRSHLHLHALESEGQIHFSAPFLLIFPRVGPWRWVAWNRRHIGLVLELKSFDTTVRSACLPTACPAGLPGVVSCPNDAITWMTQQHVMTLQPRCWHRHRQRKTSVNHCWLLLGSPSWLQVYC